ncbi:MAG TPA: ATP-binding protein [Acidimicrobiales bacterium]|nr:ATP-binding protein [Acidimicrobiales bacterium]
MHIEVAVCLPREAETVTLVRTAVTNTLNLFGVAEDCVEDIRLALSEACTNVIEHAASEDNYEVEVHVDERECAISVRNVGNGFDATALAGLPPDPHSHRGRGVAIMRAVMDSVNFSSTPETGTVVNLVRALSAKEDGLLRRLHSDSGR